MKRINLPKNYNNKLGCDYIVHLMPPAKKISSDSFDTPIEIACGDVVFKYILVDYQKDTLNSVPLHLSWLSHGVGDRDGINREMYLAHRIQPSDLVGVYFFARV